MTCICFRKLPALAALTVAAAMTHPAHAQGKDDLWEMTFKMEMEGLPMSMPAQTNKVCTEAGKSEAAIGRSDSDCRMTNVKHSGNKLTFAMECTRPERMTGTGEITRTADRLSGTLSLRSGDTQMKQTFSGQRIGSCDAKTHAQRQREQLERPTRESIQADRAKRCTEAVANLDPVQFAGTSLGSQATAEQKAEMARMAGCDDFKPKFCAKAGEVGSTMREPRGFAAARERYRQIDDALRLCGENPKAIEAAACKSGVSTRDWRFVNAYCADAAKEVAAANCVGRDYTEVMSKTAPEFRDLCARHAPQRGVAAAPRSAPAQTKPSEGAAAQDAIKEGADALRKFLKF